jgi:3-dehydroquinate dehydratase-1
MKIKYCLPIIKNTKQEVLEMVQNNNDYDFFEVWLDYIIDLDEAFVKQILSEFQEKLIILFRRQDNEEIQMSLDKRKSILSFLENTSALLDLDITIQQEELDYLKESNLNIQTIVSYHNYDETPSHEELKKIVEEMTFYHPTILKFATLCQDESDALQLLELLLDMKKQEKKYIVLGMGEKGIVTRIFGTLWGNEMIFAPKEKNESSAPGQLTKMQLENIFNSLSFRAE